MSRHGAKTDTWRRKQQRHKRGREGGIGRVRIGREGGLRRGREGKREVGRTGDQRAKIKAVHELQPVVTGARVLDVDLVPLRVVASWIRV